MSTDSAPDASSPVATAAGEPPATGVDLGALLARIHGNREAMGQLVQLMLDHLPARLDAIEAAVANGDAEALGSAAHSLKGSLSNFTTGPAWAVAAELERRARDGDLSDATSQATTLRRLVAAIQAELRAWQEQP